MNNLVLRIFKRGANTADTKNILAEGKQSDAIKAFIRTLDPGTTVPANEYVALNHDTTGKESDSNLVDLPSFYIRLRAQDPTSLANDITANGGELASSDVNSTAPSSSETSSSTSQNNLFNSTSSNGSSVAHS